MRQISRYKLGIFLFVLLLFSFAGMSYFTYAKVVNDSVIVNEKITSIIDEAVKTDLINDYGEDSNIIIYEAETNKIYESGCIEEIQKK